MITIFPYENLGHANHGWLDARHHFSFASYYDPKRVGFGELLVINDDKVSSGRGFATHPHDNMEIITYVREGAITHKDSLGNVGRTEAGDVQVMSAGSGVFHSEYNAEPVDTTLYQIWIKPNRRDVKPRWETKQFPKEPVTDALHVLVTGRIEDKQGEALFIHQDAAIFGGALRKDTQIRHTIKHQAYLLVAQGEVLVNGQKAKRGDGVEISQESVVTITATSDAEVLLIDVPSTTQH
ncbi:MAG: pirin family protein [Rickettsiales bacterium]|nr:pirin family protein [Rickettsiales bacterium]